MVLGIILPTWMAGMLAVFVKAAVADLTVVSSIVAFYLASATTFAILTAMIMTAPRVFYDDRWRD